MDTVLGVFLDYALRSQCGGVVATTDVWMLSRGGFRNPANDKDFFWSYYSELTRPHPKIFLENLGCCFIAIWPDILSFFKTFECGFSFVVLCLSKAPSLNQRM